MCVICYKPKGVSMPSRETLKAMYRANSDGCGFCTPTKYYKGLSFDVFMQQIRQVGKDEPCIIHFRLATHGSVRQRNCHPFYDAATGTYFAHNGILNVRPSGDWTDSETAFRNLFVPYIKRFGIDAAETKRVISQVQGDTCSKFAFMQGEEVRLFGEFLPYDGCYCSNLRFRYCIQAKKSYYRFNLGV